MTSSRTDDARWLLRAAVIHRWTWIIGFPVGLVWIFAPMPVWLDLSLPPILLAAGMTPLAIRTVVGFRSGYRGE